MLPGTVCGFHLAISLGDQPTVPVAVLATRRRWKHKMLTLFSLVGLTTAVALMTCIGLYADAANLAVQVNETLAQETSLQVGETLVAFKETQAQSGQHFAHGEREVKPPN